MEVTVRNNKWPVYIVVFYCALLMGIFLPALFIYDNWEINKLGSIFSLVLVPIGVLGGYYGLRAFLISFTFSSEGIKIREWCWFSIRETLLKHSDVERIELPMGMSNHSALELVLKDSRKILIDLSYVTRIEGALLPIELSQYGIGTERFKLKASVAKTLAEMGKISFSTNLIQ